MSGGEPRPSSLAPRRYRQGERGPCLSRLFGCRLGGSGFGSSLGRSFGCRFGLRLWRRGRGSFSRGLSLLLGGDAFGFGGGDFGFLAVEPLLAGLRLLG